MRKIDLSVNIFFYITKSSKFWSIIRGYSFKHLAKLISKLRLKSRDLWCTASSVFNLIFLCIEFSVFRSTIVKRTLSLLDFDPITVSISQCPNYSLVSIVLSLSSILRPRFLLFFLTTFCFLFILNLISKSEFFTFQNPKST